MTSSYSTANKQSLANISSGERLVDPRHPENGSDALDRSKYLQNPHANSSNPYPLHGSSKHTYHQLTGGHTQPPQAPGLTPYHYIHNPQLELDLQSAAGFDYGAAFGNPFESQSAMHYLPDSQFVGYRPADAYALGFESQLHNSFGPNGNSKTAATPQYSYGSHASRYGNQSYPPSQQYPDTQLLQPTFAHPSENMNPSRTVADSKVGSRNPQDCNSNIVSTSPSRGHVMTHQEYQQPGAGDPGFNMQLCAPQNPFMFAPFHPTSYPSQNERLTVGPTEMSSNSQAPNATGSLGSAVATSGSTSSMRRKNASRETTAALKTWLFEHRKNPYPTKGEKIMLAIITKMSLTQISTWFANARRRLKKENKMTWTPKNKTNNNSQSHKENKLNHTAATDNIEATKLSTGEILENEADVTFDSLDSELKLEN